MVRLVSYFGVSGCDDRGLSAIPHDQSKFAQVFWPKVIVLRPSRISSVRARGPTATFFWHRARLNVATNCEVVEVGWNGSYRG